MRDGCTDQDPVWGELLGPKEHCVRRGSWCPHSDGRGDSMQPFAKLLCPFVIILIMQNSVQFSNLVRLDRSACWYQSINEDFYSAAYSYGQWR